MANDNLRNEIMIELENLKRLVNEMNQLLAKINSTPTFLEVRAGGSILHDFYCGIEKIFERIAVQIDKNLPVGENWHIELLSQMAKAIEGIRRRIISEKLLQKLKEYMRFRHLFRHIYGFELKWEIIEPLCIDMEIVLTELKREIYEDSSYR